MSQLNILVFNSAGNDGAPSYLDYLGAFAAHSRHKIYYHNFVYEFAPDFDFSIFDVIVITHNFWPEILSGAQREALARAKALKVLFLQDEYQYVRIVNGYMAQMGIDLMFSCVAEKDFDAFYPKALIPSLREVHHVLTGYVPERLIAAQPADDEKIYDVGYRSRASPYYMGELGHEKLVIAKRFQVLCAETGLKCNISLREEDRLKGPMWMRFLRSCRVQLGTPSGSSIVDMDGSVIEAETAYRVAHPHASFEEVHQKILAPHEGKLVIDTVSPRHFEAAAAGSAMAMHEGY